MTITLLEAIKLVVRFTYDHFFFRWFAKYDPSDEDNIEGEVAVVTGITGSIGKELSLQLAKRGAKVVMACRDVKKGKQILNDICAITGNENLTVLKLDLGDMDSVRTFANLVKKLHPKIKLLFNIAGIGIVDPSRKTKDGFQIHVAVNHLGPFLLTNLLLPNMKAAKNARVVSVSSTSLFGADIRLDDLHMEKVRYYGPANELHYSNTKFMNALFMKELGHRVAGTGVTTYAICPGFVESTINDSIVWWSRIPMEFMFQLSPERGCSTLLHCALSPKLKNETGKMYRFIKPFHGANSRLDSQLAKDLWELSARLVQLNGESD